MRQLYLDCSMGAAGDMLMAALLELIPDQDEFLKKMNSLGLPGVRVEAEPRETCGITGQHIHVYVHGQEEGEHIHDHGHHHTHDHDHAAHSHAHDHAHDDHGHDHHHSSLGDIQTLINGLDIPEEVKANAAAVYQLIAQAESKVHGKAMDEIHFHEVGTADAVTDVVGVCLLLHQIGAEKIIASPVHVGSGTVRCAHGVLPVPAPATALLLKDVPVYGGEIQGELCTPTGAALLKHFVNDFGPMPVMRTRAIGYGIGTKEFPRANCVRAMLGETAKKAVWSDALAGETAGQTDVTSKPDTDGQAGDVVELAANLDDMTAEEIGFAIELLMEAGALDVYASSIIMKKSRPAVKLTCMCRPEETEKFADLMLRHTTTIGVRAYTCRRFVMDRRFEKRETPWGEVTVKICEKDGIIKVKPEFEDVAVIARETGRSLQEIKEEVK